ncbi:hypothetical protein BH09BAC2_BH09BAC2_06850 [soil metagenome]
MIHYTKGIVLKTIKYGETSVIASVFTELFGIQSYIQNGIRNSGKTSSKAAMFQPAAILELNVYHIELKSLQRIKEYKWHYLYRHVLTDVIKNTVAMYMVELLQKCLKQPETNRDLFLFAEDALLHLDNADMTITANFPLYFGLHLADFFGFKIRNNYSATNNIINLEQGMFTDTYPSHTFFLEGPASEAISLILKVQHPLELDQVKLNKNIRRDILQALQTYYTLHIQDFGNMKTLPVVQAIFAD